MPAALIRAAVLSAALLGTTLLGVAPAVQAAPTTRPVGAGVPSAARHPVPQGTSYWNSGSRIWVLVRSGNSYRYATGGTNYACEAGRFSGYRTSYRYAERVAGSDETGHSTGRMWVANSHLQYRNAALNSYSATRVSATPARRSAGARALALCARKLG